MSRTEGISNDRNKLSSAVNGAKGGMLLFGEVSREIGS